MSSVTALASRLRLDPGRAQRAFRLLLLALSEPGRLVLLDEALDDIPPGLLLPLTLADVDVTIGFDDATASEAREAVRAATGATVVSLDRAAIAVLSGPDAHDIARLRRGSALAPEDAAKVAVVVRGMVPDFDLDAAAPTVLVLSLTGPGIPGVRRVGVDGLSIETIGAVADARRDYPAGIDLWLFSPDGRVAAIARSTWIEVVG